ncbi:hypothetical protein GH733_012541 [Mirounga leonina]|nr:hypothetical protein GH733_012541 [Mirounga leonina]
MQGLRRPRGSYSQNSQTSQKSHLHVRHQILESYCPTCNEKEKTELIQKVKLAEQAKCYDKMAICMKAKTEQDAKLCNKEHNLLSMAYTNVLSSMTNTIQKSTQDKNHYTYYKYLTTELSQPHKHHTTTRNQTSP